MRELCFEDYRRVSCGAWPRRVSSHAKCASSTAHVFRKALLTTLLRGEHRHIGDAVLAAQGSYAESGEFSELLTIYHLLGDSALKLP